MSKRHAEMSTRDEQSSILEGHWTLPQVSICIAPPARVHSSQLRCSTAAAFHPSDGICT